MKSTEPSPGPFRVLVLEDVPSDAELEVRELVRAGLAGEWRRVETEAEFREALETFGPEVVLADYSLPSWNGLEALKVVRALRPELPFVIVTGSLDEETAAGCIKAGADDYVLKERLARLPHAVRSAREVWAERVARRRAEEELRLRNTALVAAADGIIITDSTGTIAWANPAFTSMTGYTLEEVRGQNPRILRSGVQREAFYRQMWDTIASGGVWRGELYNRRKDGSLYVEEMTITPVLDEDGAITHYVAIKQDVTGRRRQEEVIQSLATRDLLTGLPNQAVLREELGRIVEGGGDPDGASLVLLDVDRFSLLNSSLGHPAGDRLLVQLAERLAEELPREARLYRFGGDELAVLLPGTALPEAEKVAESLRAAVDGLRFVSEEVVFDVTASLGVVPVEPSRPSAATLALAGCFQETFQKGYILPEGALDQIPIGATQDQVLIVLGSTREDLEAAIELSSLSTPGGSRSTARALVALVEVLPEPERRRRCAPLLDQALQIAGRFLAPDHPERRGMERARAACPA